MGVLEARLAGKTGMLCPMCNSPDFKRVGTESNALAQIGFITDVLRCDSCGHREQRQRDVLQR